MREFAEKLNRKSGENQVRWIPENMAFPPNGMSNMTFYRVLLPSAVFRVGLLRPHSNPDFFSARLEIREGLILGRLDANVEAAEESEAEDSQLLASLFFDAERVTTGWDKLLTTIESTFDSDQIIGEIPANDEVSF